MTEAISINERALIADLEIHQWTGRKYDAEASREIQLSHEATTDVGRFNKILINTTLLKAIGTIASEVRVGHNFRTLPYDRGRLIAAEKLEDHMNFINSKKEQFNKTVNNLLEEYDTYVEQARVNLKTLFKETDYPSKEELATKFGIDIKYTVLPDQNKFSTLIMPDYLRDHLQKEGAKAEQERNRKAQHDMWSRLLTNFQRLHDALVSPNARMYETTVNNARDILGVIPVYGDLLGDNEIIEMAGKLFSDFSHLEVNDLRGTQNQGNRQALVNPTASAISEIEAKMKSIFG